MTITAKYPGKCGKCGGAIQPGQTVEWDAKTRRTRCATCAAAGTKKPKPAAAPKAPVEIEVQTENYTLDQYGDLRFRYVVRTGPEAGRVFNGRDVRPEGFLLWTPGQATVVNRDTALATLLAAKARLAAERQERLAALARGWEAGEELLIVSQRDYYDSDASAPVIGVPEATVEAVGHRDAYNLAQGWLRAYGVEVGEFLPQDAENLPSSGAAISKADLDRVFAARLAARATADAKAAAEQADIREFRAGGGHIVALERCWECGLTRIVGELDERGAVVRMPEPLYREALAAQREAHGRSLATITEPLSSVGFSPAEGKFRWRVVKTHHCGC